MTNLVTEPERLPKEKFAQQLPPIEHSQRLFPYVRFVTVTYQCVAVKQ